MIKGMVNRGEARIIVELKGSAGSERAVDAVIDTGFTGSLSLPHRLIEALGLQWESVGRALLADGSECLFDVYKAQVTWDGKTRRILVNRADTSPLVGTRLLKGYELRLRVEPHGNLTIRRLPPKSS